MKETVESDGEGTYVVRRAAHAENGTCIGVSKTRARSRSRVRRTHLKLPKKAVIDVSGLCVLAVVACCPFGRKALCAVVRHRL